MKKFIETLMEKKLIDTHKYRYVVRNYNRCSAPVIMRVRLDELKERDNIDCPVNWVEIRSV